MKVSLFVQLFFVLTTLTIAVSTQSTASLASQIKAFINAEKDRAFKFLRLSFHDCVGGCDGCVDVNNPENFGLGPAVTLLDNFRDAQAPSWSYADIYALAGVVAVKYLSDNDVQPSFSTGRVDCNRNQPFPTRNFPDPSNPRAVDNLATIFSLTQEEATALLGGGHSTGNMHTSNSGFLNFPWDNKEDELEEKYFKELEDFDEFDLRNVSNALRVSSQWVVDDKFAMLHCDMGLIRAFTVSGTFSKPSCALVNCPASTNAPFVHNFADDDDDLFRVFKIAYEKMINTVP